MREAVEELEDTDEREALVLTLLDEEDSLPRFILILRNARRAHVSNNSIDYTLQYIAMVSIPTTTIKLVPIKTIKLVPIKINDHCL